MAGLLGDNPFAGGLASLLLPPAPPSEKDYYEAVGRFIVAYAQAECVVHELARKLSGLKEEKARVIFHGARGPDLKSRILAMLRLSKRSKATMADIDDCLQQIDVIGTQRHKLAHRSTNYESGSLKITNQRTAKSMLEYEQDLFSLGDLLAMQLDCISISLRLSHVVHPFLRRTADKKFLREIRAPWSYRPVPPKIQKRLTRRQALVELLLQPPASPPSPQPQEHQRSRKPSSAARRRDALARRGS